MTPDDLAKLAADMRARAEKARHAARVTYGVDGAWLLRGSYVNHPNDDTGMPAHTVGGLSVERDHIAASCPANVIALIDGFRAEIERLTRERDAAQLSEDSLAKSATEAFERSARAEAAEARVGTLEAVIREAIVLNRVSLREGERAARLLAEVRKEGERDAKEVAPAGDTEGGDALGASAEDLFELRELVRSYQALADARLRVLEMVHKNDQVRAGKGGRAWNGNFVVAQVAAMVAKKHPCMACYGTGAHVDPSTGPEACDECGGDGVLAGLTTATLGAPAGNEGGEHA